jgi:prepilin-type N-terminal cleavage/methylation domain-containing protein
MSHADRKSTVESRVGQRRAFTLLELLVAAALTAALAGFIAIVVNNVGSTWARTSGRMSADARARYVLDQLELDLQGAIFRDEGTATRWMAANILNTTTNSGLWDNTNANVNFIKPAGTQSLQLNAANIADARFGQAGVWLRFFTTRRGTNDGTTTTTLVNTASAPVAVGYQIIRRPLATNTTNTTVTRAYLLHRAEARPAASGTGATARPGVLESGFNITAAAYTTSTAATNNGTVTGDPRGIQVPGSNTSSPRNLDAVLADNVIDFGVRCYVRTVAGGLRLIFPASDEKGTLSTVATARLIASLPPTAVADSTTFNQVFPEVVDVMIRVLTDEGAALIAAMEKTQTPAQTAPAKYNNNAQQWWWGVATEHSKVYTRRIVLNARPW